MRIVPIVAVLLSLAGCDKPSTTSSPPPSGSVSEFHVSIFNACGNDVTVEVGSAAGSGRQVLLLNAARETITGGAEQIFLIGKGGELLATYQPIQGKQKAQVTSDCTAIERVE
ncbi:hypothetical protein [Nannocystis radixulma]|uniref:Lysozyme inhibitor n=1 Tax=Nannocystis radixulma TaxID=2995305 RepID=A0ABT5BCZ2_9BACT|nr:hypothetical protein [Nannocystis radixulma]MDC0670927.1 hypothetical protein [Nannocystis radixulma]